VLAAALLVLHGPSFAETLDAVLAVRAVCAAHLRLTVAREKPTGVIAL
jgi:hypothetical protein